jgi:hypothetical protein
MDGPPNGRRRSRLDQRVNDGVLVVEQWGAGGEVLRRPAAGPTSQDAAALWALGDGTLDEFAGYGLLTFEV